MRYRVTIAGETREIDVQLAPDGSASVSLDGSPVDADVVRVPGGVNVILGGHVIDLAVGGKPEDRTLAAGPRRAVAQVESERQRARKRRAGGAAPSDDEIRAPMPGRIVKVLVGPGDAVEPNTPIVVIEAMKMENELRTTAAATVQTVHVTEGQSVDGNALLVTFSRGG